MKITKRRRKRYGGSLGGDIFIFVVLALLGLFMIFPIYLSVIQSLKPVEELFLFPPRLYVQNITDQNFADLLATASNMWVYMDGTPRQVFARAEELEQAGLDVPQVTQIAMALRRRGMDIDPAVYTIEELEQALLNRRGGGEKC